MNQPHALALLLLLPLACSSEEDSNSPAFDAAPESVADSPNQPDTGQDAATNQDTSTDSDHSPDAPTADAVPSPDSATDADPQWLLIWADEFDGTGLPDDTRWGYDVGGHGWGNGESQYYTDHRAENARVENGTLVIEARLEPFEGSSYTSARLLSKNKGDWTYGRFEARAMLPAGRGTWPAIWMLPTDWVYGGWPDSGEIDIMEHVGFDVGKVHGTVHTKAYNHTLGTQKGGSIQVPDATTAFHVYAAEWSPERIDFFVDSALYFSFENEHGDSAVWPFDQRFHFVLNIAIGGSWGGAQGIDDSVFPQRMVVDYVRVYQRP